ncbi:molybdopterin molybdotransferase MoeA [Desulfococcus sp.]|jgi:molybdopterin molybdotransferase|uniref:molybdopterin molybdotransferase MoeA n=1 Tax=Desulfococcus sp. TaxID=2025834 RepID=UPI003D0CC22D
MMKDFFKVMDIEAVTALRAGFPTAGEETVPVLETLDRILAEAIVSDIDLPDFRRATMDGYAVRAGATFGASDGAPACLTVRGTIRMGEVPGFAVGPGEASRISTGGMLPEGADAVVMIERTESLDDTLIEVYKSVAPGENVVEAGEDFRIGETVLDRGRRIRPQEMGVLSALGRETVRVFRRPVVGIVSTGDEIVPIHQVPSQGRIRDINTYSLAGWVRRAGGIPKIYGIVPDRPEALLATCRQASAESDMVLVSGGSSVGTRDFTIETIASLPRSEVLVHGVSISPGKPTILARVDGKPFWGLPGHVTSAMVVFTVIVRPFIHHLAGLSEASETIWTIPARITRNLPSAQGRVDYVRVRLSRDQGEWRASPVLGKSGLIHTMVKADGLVRIDRDVEGLEKDAPVEVTPL